jgi:site-specific DNA-methyltransferase (adenine-specific)
MSAPEMVYKTDRAELWLGDARDVLPNVEKESAGLILTDPPYLADWQSNRRSTKFDVLLGDESNDDNRSAIGQILTHCVRVVGQNRHLYVFGPAEALDGQKVSEVVELIWDKSTLGSGDVTSAWGTAHERISFCVSKFRHAGQSGSTNVPTRMRKGSVLSFPRPTGRKVRHPSEKPVPLLSELIESSSRRGDLVVDPFAGVGSTGVAAILTGRKSLLIEKDEKWVPIAIERLRNADRIADEAVAA